MIGAKFLSGELAIKKAGLEWKPDENRIFRFGDVTSGFKKHMNVRGRVWGVTGRITW